MTRSVIASVFALGLALPACTQSTTQEDEEVSTADAELTMNSIQEGTSAAAAVLRPLLGSAGAMSAGGSTDAVKAGVEESVAAGADSTAPGCTKLTWLGGLSAKLHFENCPTGHGSVNGELSVGVTLFPTRLSVSFDQLVVEGKSLNGFGMITFQPNVVTVDADFTYQQAGENTRVVLDEVTATSDASGVTLTGSGQLQVGPLDGSFNLFAPSWKPSECMPSSGSVRFKQKYFVPVTGTFLPSTPDNGIIQIQIGASAPYPQQLPVSCSE